MDPRVYPLYFYPASYSLPGLSSSLPITQGAYTSLPLLPYPTYPTPISYWNASYSPYFPLPQPGIPTLQQETPPPDSSAFHSYSAAPTSELSDTSEIENARSSAEVAESLMELISLDIPWSFEEDVNLMTCVNDDNFWITDRRRQLINWCKIAKTFTYPPRGNREVSYRHRKIESVFNKAILLTDQEREDIRTICRDVNRLTRGVLSRIKNKIKRTLDPQVLTINVIKYICKGCQHKDCYPSSLSEIKAEKDSPSSSRAKKKRSLQEIEPSLTGSQQEAVSSSLAKLPRTQFEYKKNPSYSSKVTMAGQSAIPAFSFDNEGIKKEKEDNVPWSFQEDKQLIHHCQNKDESVADWSNISQNFRNPKRSPAEIQQRYTRIKDLHNETLSLEASTIQNILQSYEKAKKDTSLYGQKGFSWHQFIEQINEDPTLEIGGWVVKYICTGFQKSTCSPFRERSWTVLTSSVDNEEIPVEKKDDIPCSVSALRERSWSVLTSSVNNEEVGFEKVDDVPWSFEEDMQLMGCQNKDGSSLHWSKVAGKFNKPRRSSKEIKSRYMRIKFLYNEAIRFKASTIQSILQLYDTALLDPSLHDLNGFSWPRFIDQINEDPTLEFGGWVVKYVCTGFQKSTCSPSALRERPRFIVTSFPTADTTSSAVSISTPETPALSSFSQMPSGSVEASSSTAPPAALETCIPSTSSNPTLSAAVSDAPLTLVANSDASVGRVDGVSLTAHTQPATTSTDWFDSLFSDDLVQVYK